MALLLIYEQRHPASVRPFRIAEMVQTIDGSRSRLTHQSFATFDEATQFVDTLTSGKYEPEPEA